MQVYMKLERMPLKVVVNIGNIIQSRVKVRSLFLRNSFWEISSQQDVTASWGFHNHYGKTLSHHANGLELCADNDSAK